MKRSVAFWICLVASVLLIVGGFFVPPMGVIDGSVLQAVGLLLGFGTIGMIPEIIKSAKNAKVTTAGGTQIEIEGHSKHKESGADNV